jgi:phenylacetate-CoA ligase
VITTLTKEALPMIRYRARDITRLSDEPRTCGRTHLRIMRVIGRDDDMMIIRGVNVYPSQVEAVLIGLPGLSPHYQIALTREGALDTMTVEVELAPDAPNGVADLARKSKEVATSPQVDDRRDLQGRRQRCRARCRARRERPCG